VILDGQLIGIVSVTDAKHRAQDAWPATNVSEVMTPMPLKLLGPNANLAEALELMLEHGVHQLPIVENAALVGMLRRKHLMRYMQATSEPADRTSAQTTAVARTRGTAPSHG
jgi:CBS domain-containing protein